MMHPVLLMKSQKQDRDGNVIQEGSYIYFENFTLATTDETIINYIRGLKNFSYGFNPNADYYEVTQEDAEKIRQKLDESRPKLPSLARMPGDVQKDKDSEQVEGLVKKVEQLTALVDKLLSAAQPDQAADVEVEGQIENQLEAQTVQRRTRRTAAQIEADRNK